MNTHITGNVKYYSQTENKEFIDTLKKYPPFTPEEEKDAFIRYKNGDMKARDEIVLRNQRWVYSLAKEYARDEVEVMDYVSEGNFGLLEAIDNYDVNKGFKFITIAVWYIRRSMYAYLMKERNTIEKSNNAKLFKKLETVKNDFFVRNGYQASFDEIRQMLDEKYNIQISDERDLYDLDIKSISQQSTTDDGFVFEDGDDFISATACENEASEKEEREQYKDIINPIIGALPEENQEFIKKLYGIGYENGYNIDKLCNELGFDIDGVKDMEDKIVKYLHAYQELQKKIEKPKKLYISFIKNELNKKDLANVQKINMYKHLVQYFDSCFVQGSKTYKKGETIEDTTWRAYQYAKGYLANIADK